MAEGGGEGQATDAKTGTHDVFVSYASPDSAVAEAVCEALKRAGVTCWIAPRDVTPGTFYADEIVHAIDATEAIVLILSQNAAGSPHVLQASRSVDVGDSDKKCDGEQGNFRCLNQSMTDFGAIPVAPIYCSRLPELLVQVEGKNTPSKRWLLADVVGS